MHWVLQENIFDEKKFDTLVDYLGRVGISYSIHKVVPFVGELMPDPEFDHHNVICIGSYSMRHVAKKKGWYPGVFDLFDQNFNVQKEHWGELMLNYDSEVMPFKDVHLTTAKFIRPIDDSKYFAGRVFDPEEFNEWHEKVCVLKEDYGSSLTADTLVQVMEPKEIYTEVRFWVARGEIITSSVYKIGDKVIYSSNVDPRFHEFVRTIIGSYYDSSKWEPAEAYVIDVCDTPDGLKIVEINTLNSCGFYEGDVQKIVEVLEYEFTVEPMPDITRVMPTFIYDGPGIAPMSGPVGSIWELREKYSQLTKDDSDV